jgi:RNA polymerase sigma-70 factor, ECF subfamily
MGFSSLKRSLADPRLFGQFYREHATGVLRYFARRVVDADAALDLTAETFAQAYASRDRFRGDSDEEARGWLYAIASHQFNRYLRRGYADRSARSKLSLERPAADSEEIEQVEELGEMSSLREQLATAMGTLPADYQEAVRLRVVEELPYMEVAARLAVTEATARMRVSRALRHLRSTLTRELTAGESA